MSEQNKNPNSQVDDDEIDLIALAKTVWNGRKTIIKTTLIFMAIGLFVAIFSEKEFKASTTFVTQTSESKIGGNLGGLAAMAGINLGGLGGDAGISPDLYPQIIYSIPFQRELLETPLTIDGQDEKVSYFNYYKAIYKPSLIGYIKKFTIKLPVLIKKLFRTTSSYKENSTASNKILSLSLDEYELIERLKNQIFIDVNENDGYVSISANMPEPKAVAELTYRTQDLLQKYLIDFKIQKSKEQLEYIKDRYIEVEEKFKVVQQKLAKYKDRNQLGATAMSKTTVETIQDEYTLTYGVYTQLAKQLEAQYLQVTEDTPVFTIIEPVSVPLEKHKPKRFLILFTFLFIGGLIGIGLVLIKYYYKNLIK